MYVWCYCTDIFDYLRSVPYMSTLANQPYLVYRSMLYFTPLSLQAPRTTGSTKH